MRLETKTYTVVSEQELREAKDKMDVGLRNFNNLYEGYLTTCICNAGFADKLVRNKKTGAVGKLSIEYKGFSHLEYPYPSEIKFYPLKKNGEASRKAQYVYLSPYSTRCSLTEQLLKNFEIAGDSNAG